MTDISGAMEAARVAMKDTIDLLEWMDRTGGLGYEKHERIRSEIANLMAARALLSHPQRDGEGNRGLDAAASPVDPWQPISTAPKDGKTVELRGTMLAHHMPGCKFSMMPFDWRPETPQTEWRITGWREVVLSRDQQAASTEDR